MNEEFEFKDDENQFLKSDNAAPESDEEEVIELPYTVTLCEPIKLTETNTVTELVFRNKVNLGMLLHFPTGEDSVQKIGHLMPVIKGMTGQNDLVVKRIGWEDAQECFKVVNYFLTIMKSKKSIGGTTSD
jgi:hypothetical protein